MHDIGYYGLQVSERVQAEIDSLDLTDLIQLSITSTALIATSPSLRIFTSEEFSIELDNAVEILSDIQIVGFTRYLCDRIEEKLMDIAK
jgi:hypothetical protein